MKTTCSSACVFPPRYSCAALAMALTMAMTMARGGAVAAGETEHRHDTDLSRAHAGPAAKAGPVVPVVTKLPRLPKGVAELKFNDFFVKPAGPRGLELTEKLGSLEGQRVRILGYMAHREVQPPGTFLLTPFPVAIHDHDNSLAEDMPMSVVLVTVPHLKDETVPHARGLMLLTGTLSVGNRPEADGRMSHVRLELDPPGKYRSLGGSRNRASLKGAELLQQVAKPTRRPAAHP